MLKDTTIFKDWRFYFKLGFGLLFTITLLYGWLSPIINGITVSDSQKKDAINWSWFVQDKGDFSLNYLSFFTIQTNILVALWFVFGTIFHNREGKSDSRWFGHCMTLGITTFITITGIIFNTMLLPAMYKDIHGFYGWFTNVIEHMVCPLVAIIYFVFFMNRNKTAILATKPFWKKYLWRYYVYPIIWAIIMLIRGEFRYNAGKAWDYQYFFLNVHKTSFGIPGVIWLLIVIVFISIIIFAVSTLFNIITYRQVNKNNQ